MIELFCWSHVGFEFVWAFKFATDRIFRGLWVRVQFRESSCWLHGYSETDGHACDITYWDFTRLSFPNKKWALRMVSPACLFPAVYYQETSEIIQKLLCILVLKNAGFFGDTYRCKFSERRKTMQNILLSRFMIHVFVCFCMFL